MRKRPENSWRQTNSQGIAAKTESNVVEKTTPGGFLRLGMLHRLHAYICVNMKLA